jgi:hypothetical protein
MYILIGIIKGVNSANVGNKDKEVPVFPAVYKSIYDKN